MTVLWGKILFFAWNLTNFGFEILIIYMNKKTIIGLIVSLCIMAMLYVVSTWIVESKKPLQSNFVSVSSAQR
jgi:presenilin-like A22 family membrane protease